MGVLFSSFLASIFTSANSKALAAARLPLEAAMCNGVLWEESTVRHSLRPVVFDTSICVSVCVCVCVCACVSEYMLPLVGSNK